MRPRPSCGRAARLSKPSLQVPQDRERVEALDALLKAHVGELRDYTHAFHERWADKGVTTMRGSGWALRPLLIPASRLHFIAAAFHGAMTRLRTHLIDQAGTPGALARDLPFHPDFADVVDIADGARSPAFTSHFRPDGFLFEDRYVLSEINFGNGIIVSCAYTEAIADYWRGHPVIRRLGWDVDRMHHRPFPRYVQIARQFARPVKRPRIALLSHSEEWATMTSFPKRVMDQVMFAKAEFRRAGLRARLVTEEGIALDRAGNPRFESDGKRIDLVMLMTVGTTFMDRPETLRPGGPLAHLARARIGDVWVVKPLAGLLMDKGALPLLNRFGTADRMADGFRFEVGETEYPSANPPERYLDDREGWLIKRSFDGKDTHPGVARDAQTWADVVARARQGKAYVAQRYVSLPRADVPVLVDGRHLEWVPSRIELSVLVYDGAFGGAGVRHAPEAEGQVMTDFPEGYGYTTAFAV